MKFICVRKLTVSSAIVALRAVGFGLLTTLSKGNLETPCAAMDLSDNSSDIS